jgi:hypothetical protein
MTVDYCLVHLLLSAAACCIYIYISCEIVLCVEYVFFVRMNKDRLVVLMACSVQCDDGTGQLIW